MLIIDAASFNDLVFNRSRNDYEYKSGKKVSPRQLYLLLRREEKKTEDKMVNLTEKLLKGELVFEDWQLAIARESRSSHKRFLEFGKGGKDKTYANDYLLLANEMRQVQYPALQKFARDMSQGKLSEKQILARVKLYSKTKVSYERGRIARVDAEEGDVLARRQLGSCAPHCQSCIRYALEGWKPLSQIIPPGQACECRGNCCCYVEFSKNALNTRSISALVKGR